MTAARRPRRSLTPTAAAGFAVAVDTHGNVFIADTGNQRVREVSHADGKIRTIAGTGDARLFG